MSVILKFSPSLIVYGLMLLCCGYVQADRNLTEAYNFTVVSGYQVTQAFRSTTFSYSIPNTYLAACLESCHKAFKCMFAVFSETGTNDPMTCTMYVNVPSDAEMEMNPAATSLYKPRRLSTTKSNV